MGIERGCGARIGRSEVERHAGELFQPVVLLCGQLNDIHALLNEIDEGQEKLPVEAVLVKRARRGVRGRHHDDATLKQVPE